ncbi:neuroligin-3 [Caerostris extrusa]|uniref:Neuroligin-3 n=1 Tax=Caerostris extrusa TaxID=172846 RepID=A0AAV4Y3Z9_CAEEX|nr:neuroligin-3 [Caerostris extrusa]
MNHLREEKRPVINISLEGLFQRVILQSGSAFSPWALAHESMTFTRHVARKLACPVLDHPALVRCMRQRPLSEIMRGPADGSCLLNCIWSHG